MRVLGLECIASGREHFWSVEGWIRSFKQNCLGQHNIGRLLCSHTNLILENLVADWELKSTSDVLACVLPWDIEKVIEEPESDTQDDEDDQDDREYSVLSFNCSLFRFCYQFLISVQARQHPIAPSGLKGPCCFLM